MNEYQALPFLLQKFFKNFLIAPIEAKVITPAKNIFKKQKCKSYQNVFNGALANLLYNYHYASTPNSPHAELSNIAPFQNPSFKKLFDDLSIAATTNLKFLHSDRIFSAMVTSEWLYSNFGQAQGLDNTFICAGYFKLGALPK